MYIVRVAIRSRIYFREITKYKYIPNVAFYWYLYILVLFPDLLGIHFIVRLGVYQNHSAWYMAQQVRKIFQNKTKIVQYEIKSKQEHEQLSDEFECSSRRRIDMNANEHTQIHTHKKEKENIQLSPSIWLPYMYQIIS